MFDKNKKTKEIRTSHELNLLNKGKSLITVDNFECWQKDLVIPANGIIAGGWTQDNKIVLISTHQVSVTNLQGDKTYRCDDYDLIESCFTNNGLQFNLISTDETINVFGLDAGDGVYTNKEGWRIEIIYPYWPIATVILKNYFHPKNKFDKFLDNTYALKIDRLDGWLKCGFAADGNSFMILGSAGAEIYVKRSNNV